MLWLALRPAGLGEFFGEDDFGPLSGVILLALTALASMGILRWSRLRWLGIAMAFSGAAFWVLFTVNTTPNGLSPVLAALYALAAALLTAAMFQRRLARK
jgi:hypothetical protein